MATRRHRFVTVPSGLLLFVCLFLPAIRACEAPVYPYETGVYPPYLAGLFIAALALVGPRARHAMTLIARVLMWLTGMGVVVALMSMLLQDGWIWPWALVSLTILATVFCVMGWEPAADELSATRLTIATALLGVAFFGMWMRDDPLYGLYLSAGGSLGLFVGGIEWRREILRDRERGFPAARAR